jgi:hypothetical protein
MMDTTQNKGYVPQNKADLRVIVKILERVEPLYEKVTGHSLDRLSAIMDISAAHEQHPIDLPALLDAQDYDLVHDVFGIFRHMNRSTGRLEHGFAPRYSRRIAS